MASFEQLVERLNKEPLSAILPLVKEMALRYEDYDGYFVFSMCSMPIKDSKAGNAAGRAVSYEPLLARGLSIEDIYPIEKRAYETYVALKSIDNDKMISYSVRELESNIKEYGKLIDTLSPPDNLHPTDLYYYSKDIEKEKVELISKKQQFIEIYSGLVHYTESKIMSYSLEMQQNKPDKRTRDNLNAKDVFIIHGHSESKKLELDKLLRERWNLNPIILSDQPNEGMTIIEKFEKYAEHCSYAFALFTPDDIVLDKSGYSYFQARPNVIFELGWFYSYLGRSKVCILNQSNEKSEIFSDLQGVMRIQFENNVSEKSLEIERELKKAGVIER